MKNAKLSGVVFIRTQTFSEIYKSALVYLQLFHDRGSYHIETSPLICSANQRNQWTGFYLIGTSVMKEYAFLGRLFNGKIIYWGAIYVEVFV